MNAAITDADIAATISSFKRKRRFTEEDFNSWAKICGYLYRSGAHGAGLARCRVLEALENCEPLRPILDIRKLKVLSVGGGPFNDVIGFLSAMSQMDQSRMDNGEPFYSRKVNIWVADDTSTMWSNVVRNTARLLKEGDFGYVSYFSIYEVREIKFFRDTTLPSRLSRYDVVIISKFINSLNRAEQFKLMKDLWRGLKASAFVLLIACPFRDDNWNDFFECLYLSDQGKRYSSRPRGIQFGHHNRVTSNARIAVLRKKETEYIPIARAG